MRLVPDLRLQYQDRRREVLGRIGIQCARLERVNQDDRQVAREALRVPVDAQIDFRGDRALLRRSGNGTTGCAGDDGERPEAR